MDDRTVRYYDRHAAETASRLAGVDDRIFRYPDLIFREGMRVLDVGAGSGRDVAHLLGRGCEAYGVEPSEELLQAALARYPELQGRVIDGHVPDLGKPFGGEFDGVLCSAVLMHLPKESLFDAAFAIREVLKPGGKVLLSVPRDRPGIDADNRDAHGRLFTPINADFLALLFERLGFTMLSRWESDDVGGRTGYTWCTLLFELRHGGSSRPLDQIEGILSRDKKTATYKLALFRAMSDIAISESVQARWASEDVIGIPIGPVCDRWLHYYWPLFESTQFIPQIRGEHPTCSKPVAFREALSRLVERYQPIGGLTRFVLDDRSRACPPDCAALRDVALSRIRQTIVQGPVTYAGGALEGGRVFAFDRDSREIRMSAGIWHEFVLLGHWIRDAVILRWAELTGEIARTPSMTSLAFELLLTVPIPERDVGEARRAYESLADKECTWSGGTIYSRFDVDHILPFALWHSNDLWNLVPVLPRVNAAKSDRLPSRGLMQRRRDCLIYYWERLRATNPLRFDHEVARSFGVDLRSRSWEDLAYRRVVEAVEVTAIQRGVERWQ